MLDVIDWNINPNQKWFVRLSDAGGLMLIELFNSLAAAAAGLNRVASAELPFGAGAPAELAADAEAPLNGEPLSKFNSSLPYHLAAAGADGDPPRILAIGPFTDLPSVEDPFMLTEAMIQARGELEINRGTHSRFLSSLTLAGHYPALDEGAIISVSSERRGIADARHKIISLATDIRIEGGELTFNDSIEAVEYRDFVRQ